ncbi:MAG TPA: ATP-binding protein [Gemmatimonadales bacterium]|nr:ATP-binding protein [Gemmatimonadales bacterium]
MATTHEKQITRLALAGGVPALAVALWLLWAGDYTSRVQWTLSVVMVIAWLSFAFAVRERVIRPLQTLSNMLAALRERDYSLRARRQGVDDALGLVIFELNVLTEELKQRRLGSLEATALLERVMAEIDVAVFTFDANDVLRLVNASGERLLGQDADHILGRRADELGLAECLRGEAPRVLELEFPTARGRWEVRRGAFRQEGLPHQLVVLADVSRTLRAEERLAWQRLIRVLGHEINNSLTPIRSVAQRLTELLARPGKDGPLREDLERGLELIAGRSESLTRFLSAYARLARLPPPKLAPVDVPSWIERVARLETRVAVEIVPGIPVTVTADGDQLDQLLINLIANATDAALATGGGVKIRWKARAHVVDVEVIDDGPGLPETKNLFVPFFTTKPNGSGIGLVLSQQIAEAHGGRLTLTNRRDARGCVALLSLPLPYPVSRPAAAVR